MILSSWETVIDGLIDWSRNGVIIVFPDVEDDMTPPDPNALGIALESARFYRDTGRPVPHRVCPNGYGGVTFEWRLLRVLDVTKDGATERTHYQDGQQDKTNAN